MADSSDEDGDWTSAGEEQDEGEPGVGSKWPLPLSPRVIVTRSRSARDAGLEDVPNAASTAGPLPPRQPDGISANPGLSGGARSGDPDTIDQEGATRSRFTSSTSHRKYLVKGKRSVPMGTKLKKTINTTLVSGSGIVEVGGELQGLKRGSDTSQVGSVASPKVTAGEVAAASASLAGATTTRSARNNTSASLAEAADTRSARDRTARDNTNENLAAARDRSARRDTSASLAEAADTRSARDRTARDNTSENLAAARPRSARDDTSASLAEATRSASASSSAPPADTAENRSVRDRDAREHTAGDRSAREHSAGSHSARNDTSGKIAAASATPTASARDTASVAMVLMVFVVFVSGIIVVFASIAAASASLRRATTTRSARDCTARARGARDRRASANSLTALADATNLEAIFVGMADV